MNYKREKLGKLLKLIEEISSQPRNEWFRNQLINLLVPNPEIPRSSEEVPIVSKLNLIQEYLSVDIDNLIDYSAFEEPSREQLFRDNLEMMRYQKGTPNHKVNFGEFCRYAQLQAEEMINYFLNKISNTKIEKVEAFISQFSSSYKPIKKPTDIHHIYYTNKLIAFNNLAKLSKKLYDTLWFINDFRNELSHRNSFSMQNEDKELAQYQKDGFLQNQVDFNKLDSRQKNIYNKGKYIIAKRKEDFNMVRNAIEELKDSVISAIRNPPTLSDNKVTIGSANPILATLKSKLDNDEK